MNYTEANKYLNRACKRGYVPYYSGLVQEDVPVKWGGNTTGTNWGINIDGDGENGRYFGCPQIIWSVDQAEEQFPKKVIKMKTLAKLIGCIILITFWVYVAFIVISIILKK